MDEAFQDLQDLKKNIIEKLRLISLTEDKRLELSYFKDRIEMMRPMSASGYFAIDKTTLTSMLSVRYCDEEKLLLKLLICCSLTYIIILVQFQTSAVECNCNCLNETTLTA